MALPTVTKTYDYHGINQRISYVSLLDCSARTMFKVKDELKTYGGWTVKWSCDGSVADTTDRWASSANCQTQFNGSGGAQSWIVMNGPYGDQLLISFNGATADVFRVGYSPGGNYALAGTATNQPTLPSDEMVLSTGITQVGTATSGDRIVQVIVSTDGTILRWWVYRASVLQRYNWREDVDTTGCNLVGSLVFAPAAHPVVVGNDNTSGFISPVLTNMGTAGSTVGASACQIARINALNCAIGGGGECYLNSPGASSCFSVSAPELQAAGPLVPLMLASSQSTMQGKLGKRIDAWFPYVNSIAQGDTFGSLQFVALGAQVVQWDGASAVVLT